MVKIYSIYYTNKYNEKILLGEATSVDTLIENKTEGNELCRVITSKTMSITLNDFKSLDEVNLERATYELSKYNNTTYENDLIMLGKKLPYQRGKRSAMNFFEDYSGLDLNIDTMIFFPSLGKPFKLVKEITNDVFYETNKNNKGDKEMNLIRYELYEDLNKYYLVVSVPGFSAKDIDLNFKNNALYITLNENNNYDKSFGSMSLKLYDHLDKIDGCSDIDDIDNIVIDLAEEVNENSIVAEVKNGLLKIEIEKLIPAKKIDIYDV